MTKISEALTHGLTIRESANDGSDFTNPEADYRRLFLGEDGQLHVKSAAGTVTAIGGSVATDAIWAAKGDLVVGTANDTAAVLTAGTNGKVLTAASGEATGLKWDTAGGVLTHSYVGYNTVGASKEAWGGKSIATKITLATDGLLASIGFHIDQAADNVYNTMIPNVWADDTNAIGVVIFTTAGVVGGAYYGGPQATYPARWTTYPCGLWLPAGDYWIGAGYGPSCNIYYDTSGSDRTLAWSANTSTVDGARWTQTDTTKKYSIRGSIIR